MRKLFCLKTITTLGLVILTFQLNAQYSVRKDDHFYRKRIVNRISLMEKINQPLVYHESAYYDTGGEFSERNGLIASLMNGLKQGKFVAYHPDDWSQTLDYDAMISRMKEFDEALTGENDWDEGEEELFEIEDEFQTPNAKEEWELNEWALEPSEEKEHKQPPKPVVEAPYVIDYGPYEQVVQMVEDRIFDKGRSEMRNNIDFFEIIWVDPSEVLPEKVLARFRWQEIEEQLDQTQWKNRFNDGHTRSMKDIFVMRMFHSYMIDVGGEPIQSLMEAERRRQELVEFEHNLWSY